MKICGSCKVKKADEEFAWKIKDVRRQSTCKVCHKKYRNKHYQDNKQKYVDKAHKWRNEQKAIFFDWLQTQKCKDCGNKDFRVLEFDHLRDKEFNISQKIGTVVFEVLMVEISKCDVVCANCHRIRTTERDGHYQYLAV